MSAVKVIDLALKRRGFGPLSVEFCTGEIVLLCGTSGSGKSTFCQLLSETEEADGGRIEFGSHRVGYVAHEFENQLIGSTVSEELEIGSRSGGDALSATSMEALEALEEPLREHLASDPHMLSAAWQQHLLVASLVRSGVRFFILDESLAYLDAGCRSRFLRALRALVADGCTLLVVSHQPELLDEADRVIFLELGEALYIGSVVEFRELYFERAGFRIEGPSDTFCTAPFPPPGEGDGRLLGEGMEMRFPASTSIALGGESGAGTSQIMAELMGLVESRGWGTEEITKPFCLLRQQVSTSFWRSTCAEELAVSKGAFRELDRSLEKTVMDALPAGWLEKAPWHLSHGQLRFFGVCCLLLQMPMLLLLEHPFQGLDGRLRESLRAALSVYLRIGGRVVLTTHFEEECARFGHQTVWLEKGQVSRAGIAETSEHV